MKYLRYAAFGACGLVVLGAVAMGLAALLLTNEGASRWLVRTLAERNGDRLTIGQVEGALADSLKLQSIELRLDSAILKIDELELDLDLSGLLARALVFESIDAGRIEYVEAPSIGGTSAADPPSVLMLARAVEIDSISVQARERLSSFGATSFAARYVDGRLDISQLVSNSDDLLISGAAEIDVGDGIDLNIDACLNGRYVEERIDLCSHFEGTWPRLSTNIEFELPFPAFVNGTVTLTGPPEVDLELSWTAAALQRLPELSSAEARFRVAGPLDRLLIDGSGSMSYRESMAQIEGRLVLNGGSIDVQRAVLVHGGAELVMSGTVALPELNARLDVSGRDIDPALFAAEWPGSLDVQGELTILAGGTVSVSLDNGSVRGYLRGYPIVATGGASYEESSLQLHDVSIVSRTDRLELVGALGRSLDLSVLADVRDLGLLLPGSKGSLNAQFDILGTPARPLFRGNIDGRGLSYNDWSAEQLTIAGSGGVDDADDLALVLEARGLRRGVLSADDAVVRVTGSMSGHALSAVISGDAWTLDAAARGAMYEGHWKGSVESLVVDPAALGAFELEGSVELEVGAQGVLLTPSCLGRNVSRLCMEARLQGRPDDFLSIEATSFDIGTLAPFFPDGFDAGGLFQISLALRDLGSDPLGSLQIRGTDTRVGYAVSERDAIAYRIDSLSIDAELAGSELVLTGDVLSEQAGMGSLSVTVEDIQSPDSPVRGGIELTWNDTAVMSLASPDVGEVGGIVEADMVLGGTLRQPSAEGDARWRDGVIEVPNWGFVVEGIQARVVSVEDGQLEFSATGMVGESRLELNGVTNLDPATGWETELSLTGDSLQVVQLSDVSMLVSPDLRVRARLPDIEVNGTIDVPTARVAVYDLPEQAVTPSTDAVIHGRGEMEEIHPLNVNAQIEISLGDDVRYIDTNLDARLTGGLRLEYQSGRAATAIGTLEVSGQYDAYGSPLDLDGGRLIFSGPLRDPAIDIRAVRMIGDTTVGVQLSGTLLNTQTRVFSNPAMSEADALSYLLFGRPLESTGDEDASILEGAALALGLRQAIPAIERIGSTLGLDELTVRATENDTGALMAGKYLSPKLYVRYSYGLFNRIGGLLLRYDISDRLSLETQSGGEKSMDILYTVEKN